MNSLYHNVIGTDENKIMESNWHEDVNFGLTRKPEVRE